jgi:hypothetical protein
MILIESRSSFKALIQIVNLNSGKKFALPTTGPDQGDQNGQIFAQCAIVYFGQILI